MSLRLFLSATPYHTMIAHLVLETLPGGDETHPEPHRPRTILVLTGSAASKGGRRVIDESRWDEVHEFAMERSSKSLPGARRRVDEWLTVNVRGGSDGGSDDPVDVYTGNDTDWRFQLLISAFRNRRLHLFEDGLGSYMTGGWHNSRLRGAARSLVYRSILGGRYFNPGGLAASDASGYFALRETAFPLRRNLSLPVSPLSFQGAAYSQWIEETFGAAADALNSGRPQALIISEPLCDFGLMTAEEESDLLRDSLEAHPAIREHRIWIKRHPAESDESFRRKQGLIQQVFGEAAKEIPDVFPSLESLVLSGFSLEFALGTVSTALANIKLLRPDVRVVSCFDKLSPKLQAKYGSYCLALEKLGVRLG